MAWGGTALAATACASSKYVESPLARNHHGKLELREARGGRPTPSESQVLVRYLRAGGVYFEWQGQALMTAPFATNYPLFGEVTVVDARHVETHRRATLARHLLAQQVNPDRAAISAMMSGGMRLDRVDALLVGHSHYDHIGDVPVLLREYLPNARLFVNDSGKKMLAGSPDLFRRATSIQEERGFLPPDYRERNGLIRFRALRSEHAPNLEVFGHDLSWAPGELDEPWREPFEAHRLDELRVGTTFAFLIDFLDPRNRERVAFRVHYQDAASTPDKGYPDAETIAERAVDLEVVTMPGRETLEAGPEQYPSGVLRHNRARHALVIHYEDFFRRVLTPEGDSNGVRLIPTLVGEHSEEFLQAVVDAIEAPNPGPCRTPERVEGLCADAFTLPLPGEWLLFDAERPTDPR